MRENLPKSAAMPNIVRFESFEVDLDSGQLSKHGVKLKLRDQSFQVLMSLLEHPGRVVTREELRQRLWHNKVFVDFDNNLNIVIARLRVALGDSADHPRFIETLPKRGYRFVAAVSQPVDGAEGALARRAKLLVLPFVSFSSDPAQEWVSDAVTDEIITELASLASEHLAVIARTTTMRYKHAEKDVASIGQELGVDYVVEGALRHSGDRVVITVQLIRTKDQSHLFARKYDVRLNHIFKVQSCVAQAVAAKIPVIANRVRTSTIASGRNRPTDDLTAYNEYLHGRQLMDRFTFESYVAAKQHLERAIARDPEFAHPYDALAELYWYLGYLGFVPPRQAFSAGIPYAVRAIEIDNSRAETHALLGQFHKIAEYNWSEVEREMGLALRLDPNSPVVRIRYALSGLMPHGRVEEAISELERALEFDPLSCMARFWLGIMLLLSRQFERAIEEGQKLLNLDANYYPASFVIAVAYGYQGRFADALTAQQRAVELSGGLAAMLGWLGLMLARSGQAAEARSVLQRLHGIAKKKYVPPCSFAWVHIGLREIDTAFYWLNRAVEECDQYLMPIKSYRFLDPIRSDPRFVVLLRNMNLQP